MVGGDGLGHRACGSRGMIAADARRAAPAEAATRGRAAARIARFTEEPICRYWDGSCATAASSPTDSCRRPSSTRCSTAAGSARASTSSASSPRSACTDALARAHGRARRSTCARSRPRRSPSSRRSWPSASRSSPAGSGARPCSSGWWTPATTPRSPTSATPSATSCARWWCPSSAWCSSCATTTAIDERWRFTDTRGDGARRCPRSRTRAAAAERIDAATTRDEVVAAVLALGRCYFRRVVFFIVREPWVLGWDGAGEGMDRARAAALRVPLDLPSVFQGVTRNRTMFVGRPGPEEANQALPGGASARSPAPPRPSSRSRCGAGSST